MSEAVPVTERVWTTGVAPGIFPFFGHAIALLSRPLDFLESLPARGDVVEVRLGPRRAWMVCHPDLVHQVLKDPRTFDKGGPLYDRLRGLMGDGLVTCPHDDHRRQRRLLQPAFTPARVSALTRLMGEEAASVCRSWRPGRRVDVTAAMVALTTGVTSRLLFSGSLDAGRAAAVRACLAVVVRGLFVRTVVPVDALFRLPTPGNRRYRSAVRRLHGLVDTLIAERRRGAPRDDLLGTLLTAAGGGDGADTGPLTEREVRDQLVTLLLTGVESTAMCLASVFALLADHPEAERTLHEELDAVLADGSVPGPGELARLARTRDVVTETLRLRPPGWLFTRLTTRETELAGCRLPRGATVLYSPYLLHHRDTAFPEPDRFRPERWLPGGEAAGAGRAMLPFAAGSRKCIGDTFAMTEAVTAVAVIARHWRLRAPAGPLGRPRPAATLGPRTLVLVGEPRTRPAEGGPASAPPHGRNERQARHAHPPRQGASQDIPLTGPQDAAPKAPRTGPTTAGDDV
ncbi:MULTISPECIES: cytochrome P450 [Streptomyces]|jgi:pentalenene oxygenase|uniref:Cytochrome P450 n=1 Tax=Streptomyces daghestanicus TaxID=66885 RepID=A0ABQ3PW74_9ACTN|nr:MULTISPECIES: cytochrome P450 [Streptomyces]GGT13419.1 cytochrome P450 [Streptomyces griseoviridis]GGU48830.1 cytochrome P450 [Streptomyces daghestanicus]GHI29278.1 cytochrome P450 [Streptomyces daghestanicus]